MIDRHLGQLRQQASAIASSQSQEAIDRTLDYAAQFLLDNAVGVEYRSKRLLETLAIALRAQRIGR